MTTATHTQHDISRLNSRLRSEIAAAETYKMAMDRIAGDRGDYHRETDQLHAIQREHGVAAYRLRRQIELMGGRPAPDAGARGAWAKTVQGAANLFGDRTALRALKEGEASGLKGYERSLDDYDCDPAIRNTFRDLADESLSHIRVLNGLIETTR